MIDAMLKAIVDEGKWLTFSMSAAGVAVVVLWYRYRASSLPLTRRISAAMNLGAGLTIGMMAGGHLLAVSVKLWLGTLREGSLLVFVAIGVALLVPSLLVVHHTKALLAEAAEPPGRTVMLNGWLAGTLLAMGLHNIPLAAPGLLTIAYRLHSRRPIGWAILGVTAILAVGLFAASLVFLASGQSFEQFRGLQ